MENTTIHKTKITTSLGTFEFEGSRDFIEKQVEKIVELVKSAGSTPPLRVEVPEGTRESNVSKPKQARRTVQDQPKMLSGLIKEAGDIEDLKSFYKQKNPQNHMETYAVFCYWLQSKKGIKNASIDEMWTLYKVLGIRWPKALVQVFRDGKSKKALFEAAEETGRYFLTVVGEAYVVHDLPAVTNNKETI